MTTVHVGAIIRERSPVAFPVFLPPQSSLRRSVILATGHIVIVVA